jgi:anti-sigma regulatory factor (Ser/Thr protein kinase)
VAELRFAVIRDIDADLTTVRAVGVLDLQTAAQMRGVLLEVILECPLAVVVEVGDCAAAHPAALTVFPSVSRQQSWQPVVPVLVAGASSGFLDHSGRAALGSVPAYPSVQAAARAVAGLRAGQRRVEFAAGRDPYVPAEARRAVADACHQWGLPDLAIPASMVVSELVTNVIEHTGSDVRMEVILRGAFLHIRVHDRDADEPVLGPPLGEGDIARDGGRGLRLVERYSTAWGWLARDDRPGKVIWATLRARPIGSE